ncbi:hypothetical protein [Wenling frogfish filovirus]|uniref:Uncharacterized protein n=1 Tax=Wenling frogfish filovirus TaxID=2116487 RepID=A0A2P1GMN5_9MONO|nr:hypothetical protein KM519_gp09 [Wenling frogfish filovirus]AVM87240.1 hypothetical protein [Wenling frogfish filovirus]
MGTSSSRQRVCTFDLGGGVEDAAFALGRSLPMSLTRRPRPQLLDLASQRSGPVAIRPDPESLRFRSEVLYLRDRLSGYPEIMDEFDDHLFRVREVIDWQAVNAGQLLHWEFHGTYWKLILRRGNLHISPVDKALMREAARGATLVYKVPLRVWYDGITVGPPEYSPPYPNSIETPADPAVAHLVDVPLVGLTPLISPSSATRTPLYETLYPGLNYRSDGSSPENEYVLPAHTRLNEMTSPPTAPCRETSFI